MNSERLELPQDRRTVLEQLQHSALVAAVTALAERVRRRLSEPDTSIAWEDGEVETQREARR